MRGPEEYSAPRTDRLSYGDGSHSGARSEGCIATHTCTPQQPPSPSTDDANYSHCSNIAKLTSVVNSDTPRNDGDHKKDSQSFTEDAGISSSASSATQKAPSEGDASQKPEKAKSLPTEADRYKTQYCRSYERGGICPYGYNCMFAHSPAERRTVEDNVRDGLVSIAAIEAYRWAARASAIPAKAPTMPSKQEVSEARASNNSRTRRGKRGGQGPGNSSASLPPPPQQTAAMSAPLPLPTAEPRVQPHSSNAAASGNTRAPHPSALAAHPQQFAHHQGVHALPPSPLAATAPFVAPTATPAAHMYAPPQMAHHPLGAFPAASYAPAPYAPQSVAYLSAPQAQMEAQQHAAAAAAAAQHQAMLHHAHQYHYQQQLCAYYLQLAAMGPPPPAVPLYASSPSAFASSMEGSVVPSVPFAAPQPPQPMPAFASSFAGGMTR